MVEMEIENLGRIKNKVVGNNASPNNINQTNNNTPAAGTNNGGVPVQEDYY